MAGAPQAIETKKMDVKKTALDFLGKYFHIERCNERLFDRLIQTRQIPLEGEGMGFAEAISCLPDIGSLKLSYGGGRGMNEIDRDRELASVVSGVRRHPRLQRLRVNDYCIGPYTIQKLNQTTLPASESLKQLTLWNCYLLGPQSDQMVGEWINKCKLENLGLYNIKSKGTKLDKVFQAVYESKSITYLVIDRCEVQGRVSEIIPRFGKVEKVELSGCRLSDIDARDLAIVLVGCNKLVSLVVSSNNLTSKGIGYLAKTVAYIEKMHKRVIHTSFGNTIGDTREFEFAAIALKKQGPAEWKRQIDEYVRQWQLIVAFMLLYRANQKSDIRNSVIPLATEVLVFLLGVDQRRIIKTKVTVARPPQTSTIGSILSFFGVSPFGSAPGVRAAAPSAGAAGAASPRTSGHPGTVRMALEVVAAGAGSAPARRGHAPTSLPPSHSEATSDPSSIFGMPHV